MKVMDMDVTTQRRPLLAGRTVTTGRCFIFAVLLLNGCGSEPAPAPATQPAAASARPATQPAVLNVGGEPTTFDVTAIKVANDDGAVAVILTGSDGQTPARQSFYFTASLDIGSPKNLPGQVWTFKRVEGEEVDGAVGVFMEGSALRFLPVAMTIEFGGKWPDLIVTMKGQLLRDGDETKPVSLSGTYTVRGE
jgi:hypothetical protein